MMDPKEMYLRTYREGGEVLVAVCDCDILGRRFVDGVLHIDVKADFFGEDPASEEEVEAALSRATIANLVGSRTVEHAIRLGYIERENVLFIDGIPCAQMVRM
ncbi:MAG: DUF424 family protein [Methanothrix sp.]|nr:DUF424 family protein [Methanothrix sp.]